MRVVARGYAVSKSQQGEAELRGFAGGLGIEIELEAFVEFVAKFFAGIFVLIILVGRRPIFGGANGLDADVLAKIA